MTGRLDGFPECERIAVEYIIEHPWCTRKEISTAFRPTMYSNRKTAVKRNLDRVQSRAGRGIIKKKERRYDGHYVYKYKASIMVLRRDGFLE